MNIASISDYRLLAKKRVPHFLFEYLDGGSYSEITKKRNKVDLENLELRQRVLRDVSSIDTSTELFGTQMSIPVGLAPVGLAGMYARRGELQAMRRKMLAFHLHYPLSVSAHSRRSIPQPQNHFGFNFT